MREDVKMSRCERKCEDEKMFYRPPLLEEPCAQTLSGKIIVMLSTTATEVSSQIRTF